MSIDLRATYRVQFSPGFTLIDAAGIAGYLSRLGVSHLYASPILQAATGSTHGYDVVDYHRVNDELGGLGAHARLTEVLQEHQLGQVLDIVPNHMAIWAENPWWWDVLENGPSSRYAMYFDVEWDPPEARVSNQVLIPVLGDQYGRVLEAGDIHLKYDQGKFTIEYFEHRFPVDPRSLSSILAKAADQLKSDILTFLSEAFDRLPQSTAIDRPSAERGNRNTAVLYTLLRRMAAQDPQVDRALRDAVYAINQDPDTLDTLLVLQNYRLAFWRITQRELGYRRFFDINSLIGMQMQDEQVFKDAHTLIFDWLTRGLVDGLRVDHPDGLRDPQEYFDRLWTAFPHVWVVVEKILEPSEQIPETWPVAGTTGYDFLNQVNGIFIDPQAERPLTDFYTEFTGREENYPALVREKKLLAAHELLGSDLARLTALLLQVCERHRRYRDTIQPDLRALLGEVAACLPVYRTYVRAETGWVSAADAMYIHQAIEAAKANRPDLDGRLFDFFCDLLLLRETGELENELVMRFQQFTGPVMAKGVEDTLFYVDNRFISLNEVGGNPGEFGTPVERFHQFCADLQERWPRTMLATSTHDTKRSEDVRARLDVLSEIPAEWIAAVRRWTEINERYRSPEGPDRNDEYQIYQTLVGAWPINFERMAVYMEKACREAKIHTSWRDPHIEYEQAVRDFLRGIFADEPFLVDLGQFIQRVTEPGRINSLAQVLLKLTAPGVPDIYQGTEIWNLSLVDPDNRRPVDFPRLQGWIDELEGLSPEQVLARMDEGLPKLWVIKHTLDLRRRRPELFDPSARYTPLKVPGDLGVVYLRGEGLAVIVPRFSIKNRAAWGKTMVHLPEGRWRNELTLGWVEGGEVSLACLLEQFPVCLLTLESDRKVESI